MSNLGHQVLLLMCTTVMVIGRVGEEIRDWTLESIPVATPHRECAGLLVATAAQHSGRGMMNWSGRALAITISTSKKCS